MVQMRGSNMFFCCQEICEFSLNYLSYPLLFRVLGPLVQSIVSLTSSLRGQLVKCFTTLEPTTYNFITKYTEFFG